MTKSDVAYTDFFPAVNKVLTSRGLLLACTDQEGKTNAMTIGWGAIGSIWGLPLWMVLVRPSRYTYGLIERAGDFTVNVPPEHLEKACAFCGSESGRDHDKMAELRLTTTAGRSVRSHVIDDCVINYECRVVHKNDVLPGELAQPIARAAYSSGDYHRVYYGQILAVYADPDAAAKL